jgi:molybdenum cofactor cytidylyltransferase
MNTQPPSIENRQSAIENDNIAVIVLAAGASTRMPGHIKPLLPWRGKTLIEHIVAMAQQSRAQQVIVVLGAHADAVRGVVEKTGARVIVNSEWETGQASSIRAGLRALGPEIAAAIFLNADQPFVTSAMLDALMARYRQTGTPIIVSAFAGRRGNPALFARTCFADLQTLQGEQGGRVLFARYSVLAVEFDDARLGMDIDTLDDYQLALRLDQN